MPKTRKNTKEKYRFIVLIPHRDTFKLLEEYRQKLFSLGFAGAHAFPIAAPLAELSRPFSREELKETAGNIRELTMQNDGKIQNKGTFQYSFPGFSRPQAGEDMEKTKLMLFFGPRLNLEAGEEIFPVSARKKILLHFLPPVLPPVPDCAPLSDSSKEKINSVDLSASFRAAAISFRAAALANLVISPLGSEKPAFSYEWKIGAAVWLPAYRKS